MSSEEIINPTSNKRIKYSLSFIQKSFLIKCIEATFREAVAAKRLTELVKQKCDWKTLPNPVKEEIVIGVMDKFVLYEYSASNECNLLMR